MRVISQAMLLTVVVLGGCYSSSSPSGKLEGVVVVDQSTTLEQDATNIQFVVRGNDTIFDLGGHTLRSTADINLVVLESGYTGHGVRNGTLDGSPHGNGVYIASCVQESDVPLLNSGTFAYEHSVYARCSHNPVVADLTVSGFNNGVYVSPYVTGSVIAGNVFKNVDNVPVYLDTASTEANVSGNTFYDNGWREADSIFVRRRGHIAVDASHNNTIEGNAFHDSAYKWALFRSASNYPAPMIELYRNCGEPISEWKTYPVLPRLHGANNNVITNNTFTGKGLAMWFAYRKHSNICNPVIYPDKSTGNVVSGNVFGNGIEHVRDDGTNNTY